MSAAVEARGRLTEVEPGEWDGLLRDLGLADAYLTRAYVEASCVLDPGRPVFLSLAVDGGAVVFAGILREIPGGSGRTDVTTPYGYGGPVAAGDAPVEAFWSLYDGWCAERRVVTTFLRFHPLFGNVSLVPSTLPLVRLADTATWPLDGGLDLAAGMHSMHRRGARKAGNDGVSVHIELGPRLDAFVELYEAAMRRVDADPYYLFARPYWEALARLGGRLVRADVSLDGELLASQLHLAPAEGAPPWLHYHLGATTERGFELGASKLLFLRTAEWAQDLGCAELHLGSGLGGREDSLWQFKQRFSAHPGRPFWLGKAVHDGDAYRELAGTDSVDGFFPAYRAPA